MARMGRKYQDEATIRSYNMVVMGDDLSRNLIADWSIFHMRKKHSVEESQSKTHLPDPRTIRRRNNSRITKRAEDSGQASKGNKTKWTAESKGMGERYRVFAGVATECNHK
ncbi:hypothetical protein CAPTEDRAFT_212476 [Capitella teleta]|uniref:Uncharacterized protein n=1 Tax=Capitella teleta TaxID=283909 RepID=R7TZG9_CAPTE|nr:hypothetical protein CAPTEDRAFT_212476 [Capitella teleta]|eukprot:ELT99042.1 hypothetical protein CAPTEDRAFT_212476 [Capitella teleta]